MNLGAVRPASRQTTSDYELIRLTRHVIGCIIGSFAKPFRGILRIMRGA
jgi:hypothetical protein